MLQGYSKSERRQETKSTERPGPLSEQDGSDSKNAEYAAVKNTEQTETPELGNQASLWVVRWFVARDVRSRKEVPQTPDIQTKVCPAPAASPCLVAS